MNKVILFLILSMSLFSGTEKFEFGFASPIQLHSPIDDIKGFRLSTAFTVNRNIDGIDLVVIGSATNGQFNGLRIGGLFNHVEKGGDFYSVLSFLNNTKGFSRYHGIFNGININEDTQGMRISGINYAKKSSGLDIAILNFSWDHHGNQIGLINISNTLDGNQYGLFNYAKNSEIFPLLPIYNTGKKP